MEKMTSLFEDNEFDLELTSRYEYSMVEKQWKKWFLPKDVNLKNSKTCELD